MTGLWAKICLPLKKKNWKLVLMTVNTVVNKGELQ